MKTTILTYLSAVVLIAGVISAQSLHREVKRTDEKEVRVKIESSFGSVNIAKGSKDRIVAVSYKKKEKSDDAKLDLRYYVNRGIGDLKLEMHPEGTESGADNGESGIHINANINFKTDEWYIELAEGLPLSIDADLGAGKSDFDLSGLTINDLSISTGASSSRLSFDEKNTGEIKTLRIESGVSKFVANNLNNANFNKLEFDGGVGSYILDFGGELKRNVKVDINVGLGSLNVIVPKNIGLRIKYEDSWLSNFSLDDEEFIRKRKGIYESQNYAEAEGKMDVYIESGLGSVRIKRSK
ncbi:MAG: LiaF domain-containing protein [Bacteroidota bacterium]